MSDGRKLFLHPPESGGTYLSLGSRDHVWFDDQWIYETLEAAIDAWRSWDPSEAPEPDGWWWHPRSGRRRPGGNPNEE